MSLQSLPTLSIETEHNLDACVIRIKGELDVAGSPVLELTLREAEQARAPRIILDLEALEFIDSSGLSVLVMASRRSASNGKTLEVTRGKGQPAEMFHQTSLDRMLPLTDPALCPAIHGSASVAARVGS